MSAGACQVNPAITAGSLAWFRLILSSLVRVAALYDGLSPLILSPPPSGLVTGAS
jgi:hypothetical protein